MSFYGYLLLGLSVVYLFFEFAFNARLLDLATLSPILEMVHSYETYGRALSATGMALLALRLVPARRLNVVKTYGMAAVLFTAIWVAGFHGQKMLVDYLVDQTSTEDRMNAQYLALLKRGLASNTLQLQDIEITQDQLESAEFKTFISIIGLLTYFSDDVVDHFKNETDVLLDRFAEVEAARRLPEVYQDYQEGQARIEDAWSRYNEANLEYQAGVADIRRVAEDKWSDIGEGLYQKYEELSERSSERDLRKNSVALAAYLPQYFRSRDRCEEARIEEDCRAYITLAYDQNVTDLIGAEVNPYYWCHGEKTTPTLKIINGRMISQTQTVQDCSGLTQEHILAKLTAIIGAPKSFAEFKQDPQVRDTVRERIRQQGVRLPVDWTLDDKEVFIQSVIRSRAASAHREFVRRSKEEAGYELEPGLTPDEFTALPVVQNPLRNALGISDEDHIVPVNLAPETFGARYVKPAILSAINKEKRKFEESAQQFRDGGSREAEGKAYVTSLIIPTVALSFSLLFGVLNFIGIVVTVLGNILKQPRAVTAGVVGLLVAVLFALPMLVPVNLAKFRGLEIITGEFRKAQGSAAYYLTNWVINTEPRLYPFGAAASSIVPPITYDRPNEPLQKLAQQSVDMESNEGPAQVGSQDTQEYKSLVIPEFTFGRPYLMIAEQGTLLDEPLAVEAGRVAKSIRAGADGVSIVAENSDFDQWKVITRSVADVIREIAPVLTGKILSIRVEPESYGLDRCMQLEPLLDAVRDPALADVTVMLASRSVPVVECLGRMSFDGEIHFIHDPRDAKTEFSSFMVYEEFANNRDEFEEKGAAFASSYVFHDDDVYNEVYDRVVSFDFVAALNIPFPVAKTMQEKSSVSTKELYGKPVYIISEGDRGIHEYPASSELLKGVIGKL